MSSISDKTQTLTIPIDQYLLKLKVNLDHTKKSVAKLIDVDNKTHKVAEVCIFWIDLDPTIPSKKIPNMVLAVAKDIIVKPATYFDRPFEVRIPLKRAKSEAHFEPLAREELPKDKVRILTVKTKDDYSQIFALYKSEANLFLTPHISSINLL